MVIYTGLYTGIDLFIAIAVITENIFNNYYGLQMASHSKEVAVVAESIRCLGQETEQYEVCSPELNLYLC